ncbi:uncharacterized protein G2W53_016070 [Senna tora]|uniref:Uncharacterized protein n=1 Tax=Senna tora TaxID=362788 RepID=A0A834WWP2_9FABA|nr:uncharacterized protein G2W53_016070 [Senna tora]
MKRGFNSIRAWLLLPFSFRIRSTVTPTHLDGFFTFEKVRPRG